MKLKDLAVQNLEKHNSLIKKYKDAELTKRTKNSIENIITKNTLGLGRVRVRIPTNYDLIRHDFFEVTGQQDVDLVRDVIDAFRSKCFNYLKSEGFTKVYTEIEDINTIVVDIRF